MLRYIHSEHTRTACLFIGRIGVGHSSGSVLAIGFVLVGLVAANAWSSPVGRGYVADSAGALSVNDTGHLHLVHASGYTLVDEGRGTGTLPGIVKASFTLHSATATSEFTLEVRGRGSIFGRASGDRHEGHDGYESFAGVLKVTHGTGRYSHASGTGKLYGTIDRVNDAVVVQVIGVLHD